MLLNEEDGFSLKQDSTVDESLGEVGSSQEGPYMRERGCDDIRGE